MLIPSLSFRTKRSGVRNLLASKGVDPSLSLGVTKILGVKEKFDNQGYRKVYQ